MDHSGVVRAGQLGASWQVITCCHSHPEGMLPQCTKFSWSRNSLGVLWRFYTVAWNLKGGG